MNVSLTDDDGFYHNNLWDDLGKMASQVNLSNGKTLYDIMWQPNLHGYEFARDISSLLQEGYDILKSDKPKYKSFNPENGNGTFSGLCSFISGYKDACLQKPNAKIHVVCDTIDYDALNFKEDRVSQLIKFLHTNNAIRLTNTWHKLLHPIPYDFRIDRCCSSQHINNIGLMMADRVIEIEKDLNEIIIKPPTPKFIILKKSKEGETFLDVDWSGVEKYCITLIPNIDENYIADIVMGWDQQNQDFQAYPEKIDEYNLSLYNYVNERLKSYKSKYLQEITIKSPHPLDKIPLLKPGTQIYSEFKISGRTYKISGEVRYISGPDTNDNHYFIIIHKNNRNLASPEEYLDIPADKTEYKFHQQRAAKGEFVGKQPFGTLFLDNMTIIIT